MTTPADPPRWTYHGIGICWDCDASSSRLWAPPQTDALVPVRPPLLCLSCRDRYEQRRAEARTRTHG